jgi:urea carboxylase
MSRSLWKPRAEAAGIALRFGSPLPTGRRLRAWVVDGAVRLVADETARWRGHPLVVEVPAALDAEATAALARTVAFGGETGPVVIEAVLGEAGLVVVDVLTVDAVPAPAAGVTLTATVRTVAPYRGTITALTLPSGATTTLVLGERAELVAGVMVANLVATGRDRAGALTQLTEQAASLAIGGPLTDAPRLRAALPRILAGLRDGRDLDDLPTALCAVEVLHPGLLTTVQDWPGRLGRWAEGVPPSGPFDDRAFRIANRLVGNPEGAAGLEMTLVGPRLRFHVAAIVCLTGAPRSATLDGRPLPLWTPVAVSAGGVIECGPPGPSGCRGYLAVRHGLAVPEHLGSRATFDLGGFGGHGGRALAAGDLVPLAQDTPPAELARCCPPLPRREQPAYPRAWTIAVHEGPHAAPDFFTSDDMAVLYAQAYQVHHNSSRTGIRLIGPRPRFARRDGGEAGLHPSNIHDNAYAIGAIDFTGDMPILLGPDGPSCGGFVCPAVVTADERWKLGQLRPGDTVRFHRRDPALAAVVATHDDWVLRRAGDDYLLVEVGPPELDLGLRLRVQLLLEQLQARTVPGLIDLTPGIRSLQLHVDPARLTVAGAAELVRRLLAEQPAIDAVAIPRRTVWLPLSWDDPQTRKAIDIYMRSVNPTAPWCPSNLEFIRRINGLDDIAAVQRIVFAAEYLVLGLGDVYLGAPVATPLDPRHRLVTTKYNPARTWTPQNAVGIGGAYMCIYGMEGPGGYQFVGRTVPIWDTWGADPCVLRCFDVIRFFPVSAEELLELRRRPYRPRIEAGTFSWSEYQAFLQANAADIDAFRQTQRAAFAAERARWEATP